MLFLPGDLKCVLSNTVYILKHVWFKWGFVMKEMWVAGASTRNHYLLSFPLHTVSHYS